MVLYTSSSPYNLASSSGPCPSVVPSYSPPADISLREEHNPCNMFPSDWINISPSGWLDDQTLSKDSQAITEDISRFSDLPGDIKDVIKNHLAFRWRLIACEAIACSKFCPPFLNWPLTSSSANDQFSPTSPNTDDATRDLHYNALNISSAECTGIPSPNFEGHMSPSPADLPDDDLMIKGYFGPLSPDRDPCKESYLEAAAKGLFCIDVGKALGPGKLVVYNPLTQELKVLPPLFMHPVVMHLRVDGSGDYKVLVAGNTTIIGDEDRSLISKVYSSTACVWEPCQGALPCPPFGLDHLYQNGAVYKDSDRELLFYVAILDEEGTKGLLVYDLQKEQWQDTIKRPIPLVTRLSKSPNVVPRLITAHVIGCGGSIFVFSEQECGGNKHFCFHKLNLESLEEASMWKEVRRPYNRVDGLVPRGLEEYPQFTCVPGSATFVECAGRVFAFSEQEIDDKMFICIHHLNYSGDGVMWEEIFQFKRTRYRGPIWKPEEIDAFFIWRERALVADKSKPAWKFISENLKRAGYNRSPESCEDLWGTLLKHFRDVQSFLQLKKETDIWNMNGDERAKNKLPRVFTLDWYEKTEKIHVVKKPRKKRAQIVDASNDSSVTLANSLASSSGLPAECDPYLSAPPASTPLAHGVHNSIVQGDEEQTRGERPAMVDLTSTVDSIRDLAARRDWTNEQLLEVIKESNKATELQLEKDKLEFQKLQLGNKAHRYFKEPRPRKRVRKQTL